MKVIHNLLMVLCAFLVIPAEGSTSASDQDQIKQSTVMVNLRPITCYEYGDLQLYKGDHGDYFVLFNRNGNRLDYYKISFERADERGTISILQINDVSLESSLVALLKTLEDGTSLQESVGALFDPIHNFSAISRCLLQ